MDHQVEDNRDVGAAWIELSQAMRLDEEGFADERLGGDEGRVETLDMAHLHLHSCFFGQSLECVGLVGSGYDRLLDEDMTALHEGLGGALEMADSGSDDIHHVNGIHQGVYGLKALHAHLSLHLFCRVSSGIKETHQLILFDLFDAVDMDLAQMSCT